MKYGPQNRFESRIRCSIILGALIFTSLSESSRVLDVSLLDSESLVQNDKKQKKITENQLRKSEHRVAHAPTGLLSVDALEITEIIRGLNLLLSKNLADPEKQTLLLNRAMASYSLARRKLLDSNTDRMDEAGLRLLKLAERDAQMVQNLAENSGAGHARALYVIGLVEIYRENYAKARMSFEKSLNVDSESENTGWMALYVAEDYFESADFKKAYAIYGKYLGKMDLRAAELARYKMAWCLVNLGQIEKAKKSFVALIKQNSQDGFGKDSIKDLAFLMATHASEAEIISESKKLFRTPEQEIAFLNAVLSNHDAKGALASKSLIIARLMEADSDSSNKCGYLIRNLSSSRREFASSHHFKTFLNLRDTVQSENLGKALRSDQNRSVLDIELQNLLRVLIEAYADRIKSPENLSRKVLASNMKAVFQFYEKFLWDSLKFKNVQKLWLDLCYEENDWQCVDRIAEKGLKNENLAPEFSRLALDRIEALENLVKESKNYRPKLLEQLSNFHGQFSKSAQWTLVTSRYLDLLVEDANYEVAMPIANRLYENKPSADGLAKIYWILFHAEQFNEILADSRAARYKNNSRIEDLRRESALKIAISARERDEFQKYRKAVLQFLALRPSPEKADLARLDYFKYLLDKEKFVELSMELNRLSVKSKCSSQFATICEQVWYKLLELGKLSEALDVYQGSEKGQGTDYFRLLLTRLLSNSYPSVDELKALGAVNQDYLVGLLSVVNPAVSIKLLSSLSPLKRESQRVAAALAIRLNSEDWDIALNSVNKKLLGPKFSFVKKEAREPLLRSEHYMQRILVPSSELSALTVNKTTAALVDKVRQMRMKLNGDLKSRASVSAKIRAASLGSKIENQMATYIRVQAIPHGLSGAQLESYTSEVEKLASSYEEQAKQWSIVANTLEQQSEDLLVSEARKNLGPLDLSQFSWPTVWKDANFAIARQYYSDKKFATAFLWVELIRTKFLKSTLDYYRLRAALLLSLNPNAVMRRYVVKELSEARQTDLVNELFEMTTEPLSDSRDSLTNKKVQKVKRMIKSKTATRTAEEEVLDDDLD